MPFQAIRRVLFCADLAGYTRATADLDALDVATFIDAWYCRCAATLRRHGGRVVKYMGDACLATFPEDGSVAAVDAAHELQQELEQLRAVHSGHPLKVELGANVHLARVAEGEFGPEDDRRHDIIGSEVNHLFLMGSGAGIRVSEPVYRQLPNDRHDAWTKKEATTTYIHRSSR